MKSTQKEDVYSLYGYTDFYNRLAHERAPSSLDTPSLWWDLYLKKVMDRRNFRYEPFDFHT